MALIEFGADGRSMIPIVPADFDWTLKLYFEARWIANPSAIGERQIFAVQTNSNLYSIFHS